MDQQAGGGGRMNFELLAEERSAIESGGLDAARWTWQAHVAHLRRGVVEARDLTARRGEFLIRHALELDGVSVQQALDDPRKARGAARSLPCAMREIDAAGLRGAGVDVAALPLGSAAVDLRFRLISPLLTRDDDAFHLFDNPVRKDHVFGVPFLAAASLKGLAADAFRRGFPVEGEPARGNAQERTVRYRRSSAIARRLFGIASDEPEAFASAAGRLHFAPAWFPHVQYLVMNPTKNDGSGIGTLPIHFEAVAPADDKGRAVEGTVSFFYFNPAGAAEADLETARTDVACLVGALAAWWPALGLGAKRLAGYGAVAPLAARCRIRGSDGAGAALEANGAGSWAELARRIAEDGA